MLSAEFDPCYLYKKAKDKLAGASSLANDDSINIRDTSYQVAENEATKSFITKRK